MKTSGSGSSSELIGLSKEEIHRRKLHLAVGRALGKRHGTLYCDELEERIRNLAMYHPVLREQAKECLQTLRLARLSQDIDEVGQIEEKFLQYCETFNIEEDWRERHRVRVKVLERHYESLHGIIKD